MMGIPTLKNRLSEGARSGPGRPVVAACVLAAAGSLLAGCGAPSEPKIAATVDGVQITSASTDTLYKTYLNSSTGKSMAQDMGKKAVLQSALSFQIEEALLSALAKQIGVSVQSNQQQDKAIEALISPAMAQNQGMDQTQFLHSMKNVVLTQTMAAKLFPTVPVTDQDLQDQWAKSQQQAQASWSIKADVGIFNTDVSQQLQTLTAQGTSFADASNQLGAIQESDFTVTPTSPFPPTFLSALDGTAVGQITPAVPSANRQEFLIGHVVSHDVLPALGFNDPTVQANLTNQVKQVKQASLFYSWFDNQATHAKVKVDRYYGYWVPSAISVQDKPA